jgi:hypothetical protein
MSDTAKTPGVGVFFRNGKSIIKLYLAVFWQKRVRISFYPLKKTTFLLPSNVNNR